MNRRDIIRAALFGAGASIFSRNVMASVARAAGSTASPSIPSQKLLVIFLRGGNDAMNTLIPYGDSSYRVYRPSGSSIPFNQSLALTGVNFTRINQELSELLPIDTAGRLAWLSGVGDPEATRSHFSAMDRMETAAPIADTLPTVQARDGFVAGLVSNLGGSTGPSGDPRAAGFASRPIRMFRTATSSRFAAHVQNLEDLALPFPIPAGGYDLEPQLAAHAGGHSPSSFTTRNVVEAENLAFGLDARTRFEALGFSHDYAATGLFPISAPDLQLAQLNNPVANVPTYDPKGAAFLRSAEQAITALEDIDELRFASIDFGGWDTHGNQPDEHPGLLRYLAWGLRDLDLFLQNASIGPRTTVLVVSEFGRTIKANGNMSTDHGVGGLYLAMGQRVLPGTYNIRSATPGAREFGQVWSPLASQFTNPQSVDALDVVTEWRDVLAHVCEKVFLVPSGQLGTIIPGYAGPGAGYLNFLQ